MDLLTDNVTEVPPDPFPDVTAEMPDLQLECEQGVDVAEEPYLPSEEDELAASVDNANSGPQDKTDIEREACTTRMATNIVYNINVDVVNDQPSLNLSEDQDQDNQD